MTLHVAQIVSTLHKGDNKDTTATTTTTNNNNNSETADFNRPDIVFIDRKNTAALLLDIAVPLTHNLLKLRQRKLRNMIT
jgi:hypothetical protein